jgi:hypothetical protein
MVQALTTKWGPVKGGGEFFPSSATSHPNPPLGVYPLQYPFAILVTITVGRLSLSDPKCGLCAVGEPLILTQSSVSA